MAHLRPAQEELATNLTRVEEFLVNKVTVEYSDRLVREVLVQTEVMAETQDNSWEDLVLAIQ
jgi:hypothetical protein